jgi:hypothetical protein
MKTQNLWLLCFVSLLFIYFLFEKNTSKFRSHKDHYVTFDNRLVQSFKIKIGVWKHKDNMTMYQFVQVLKRVVPLEIVPYSDKFQPFDELQRRNVDVIFTNEKDYMIHWLAHNQKKTGEEMQLIAYGYFLYLCMVANYKTIVRPTDINNSVVALEQDRGHEFEKGMLRQYRTHPTHRHKDDLAKDLAQVGTGHTDLMFVLGSHPNKLILEASNKYEIYLMSLRDAQISPDNYDQYLFLQKKKLDLSYYPQMFQRYNARDRMDSLEVGTSPLIDVYAVKTLFLGLDTLNTPYIYQFTKTYFQHIFEAVAENIYFNNFNDLDTSASRLTGPNGILSVHAGARQFFTEIGNYTLNPAENCALLQNACRPEQLAAYGDYAMPLF